MTSNPRSDIVRGRFWEISIFLGFEQVIELDKLLYNIKDYLSRESHIRTLFGVTFEIPENFIVSWRRSGRGKFGEIYFIAISKR
jgi:hypothetical protein